MAGVIDGFRWALTGHGVAPGPLMLASASAVMVVVLGGLFSFSAWRAPLRTASRSALSSLSLQGQRNAVRVWL